MDSRGEVLDITVPGEPCVQPRGKPVFAGGDRTKRVRMVSAHADHAVWPWRERIVYEARKAAREQGRSDDPAAWARWASGPLILSVLFVTKFTGKPKKRSENGRRWHDAAKDLENFLKPLKDALTEAGIWGDDGQVVLYGNVGKIRAAHGEQSHTRIRIQPAPSVETLREVWA